MAQIVSRRRRGLAAAALVTGSRHDWRNEMTGLIPPYYNYTAFVLTAAAASAAAWVSIRAERAERGGWPHWRFARWLSRASSSPARAGHGWAWEPP